MSRFRKTHQNDRGTYKYVYERIDTNGSIQKEVVEIRPGEDGVTEVNIQELHRADDRAIYNFYKNARPERTEAEREKIKEWKKQFREDFNNEHGYYPLDEYVDGEANDYFKRNYNLSLNEFDDVCDEGDNPIQSVRGNLIELSRDGLQVIEKGPQFTFWRAPISNDMEIIDEMKKKQFLHLEHDIVKDFNYEQNDESVKVKVETIHGTTNSAWHYQCTYVYTIYPNGDIVFSLEGNPAGKIDMAPEMLPRLGVKLALDKDLNNVKYFGRGPRENYKDSKEAASMGVYDSTVEEMFTNYVVPQANGNRMDTSWVALTNDRGMGLLTSTEDTFNFSTSYYEEVDLDQVLHTCDLRKRDYVVLNIDYSQNALGSYSCGQWQMKKYRTTFEKFKLSFRLTPFNNKEISAAHLAHQMIIDKNK